MAKTFFLNTSQAGTFIFQDLGERSFTHPLAAPVDLNEEYDLEDLRDSEELRASVVAGDITITFDSVLVDDGAKWDANIIDFNNAQVAQNASDITDNANDISNIDVTGKKTITWIANRKGKAKDDQDLRNGEVVTNKSPFIAPYACSITGITVQSKLGTSKSYNILIVKNGIVGSPIHTEAVSASDNANTQGLSIALAAGDKIRIRFDETGDDVEDITSVILLQES